MSYELYMSTTGTQDPVTFDDLSGKSFLHPITDYNIGLEFSLVELMESIDFWNAVEDGYIIVKDSRGYFLHAPEDIIGAIVRVEGLAHTRIHLFDDKGCHYPIRSSYWRRMGMSQLNTNYLQKRKLFLHAMAMPIKAGKNALLRIQDVTRNITLCTLSIVLVGNQWLTQELSNLPVSGKIDIELQGMKGQGQAKLYWAYLEII